VYHIEDQERPWHPDNEPMRARHHAPRSYTLLRRHFLMAF
jgi:hypothetical protein